MEKYGTYEIWENTETGEILRKKINNSEDMEKIASGLWKRREDLEKIEEKDLTEDI